MFSIGGFKRSAGRGKPRKIVGQKPPLKLKDVWAIRMRLQLGGHLRDLALFNLAIDSKLRGCDFVSLRVQDIWHSGQVASRAIIMQQKTQRPVQFEITEQRRATARRSRSSHRGATDTASQVVIVSEPAPPRWRIRRKPIRDWRATRRRTLRRYRRRGKRRGSARRYRAT